MTRMTAVWTVLGIALIASGSVGAHHSLILFDASAPVWVKGAVVSFEAINPHSTIVLDQEMADGQVQRWTVVGGPALPQLQRAGIDPDLFKAGDLIEACGFRLREDAPPRSEAGSPGRSRRDPSTEGRPEHFMNGTLVVMADGQKRVWSNYGQLHRCLGPDDQDLLIRR